jgi:hypothetical protein
MIKTREILPVLRLALSSGYNRGILSEGEQISRGNRNHCDSAPIGRHIKTLTHALLPGSDINPSSYPGANNVLKIATLQCFYIDQWLR